MERTKFKRTELSTVRDELIHRQRAICPICGRTLLGTAPINIVVDHDHKTGIVRAAVHRRCNGLEGKVLRVFSTWGSVGTKAALIKYAKNLVAFWELHSTPQTEWIYWDHKTANEKTLALNKKRRRKAAAKRKES